MKLTLGLHTGHESSSALFNGTELVAAVSDERITRIKNDGGKLMNHAIDTVLKISQTRRDDITALAMLYTFYPDEYFLRESIFKEIERSISRVRHNKSGFNRPQMLLSNFLERLYKRGKSFEKHFRGNLFLKKEGFNNTSSLAFYDHHDTHALGAAFFSGFNNCAVITMDGVGDWGIHHTSGIFANGSYTRQYVSNQQGASAGMFYGHITQLLGYKPMRHEGKIVGLAAMGTYENLYDDFNKAFQLSDSGNTLSSIFSGEDAERQRINYLKEVSDGHSREDISATTQQILEDVVLQLIKNYLKETGLRKLALNGGVFANVKLNQRIAMLPELDDIFIFPAMSDTGNSVGAALLDLYAHDNTALQNNKPLKNVYLGPEFSNSEIQHTLEEYKLPISCLSEDELVDKTANAIHQGKIIGWFQGRMEFGPRALGNRSMLARPTDKEINDWLNQRLDRSEFMPFAPSVLAEYADDIFIGIEKARYAAEFMTVTFDVKEEWQNKIKAVVHVDGTARPQLVRADRNPRYHKLISVYHSLSGIPLVLNTSFNAHEEPIVCAPKEAIDAFVENRIDCLAIGNFWLEHTDK